MEQKNILAFFDENYPLVKIVDFDASSKLFYDARANMVFMVNNEDIPVVAEYLRKHEKEEVIRSYPEIRGFDEIVTRIDDLQNKGVLLPGPVEQLISTDEQDVKERIAYNMENIFMRKFVLETTQQCNFRCKYCFNTH